MRLHRMEQRLLYSATMRCPWMFMTAVALLWLCLGLLSAGRAEAQELSAPDQAVVFFERAREAFEVGEFERSSLLLREAIALHDVAALHYNLARALQELGQWREARDEYRLFLQMQPDTDERTRVEARIRLLEQHLSRSEPSASETSDEAGSNDGGGELIRAEDSDDASEPSNAPWWLVGTGVASVAAGAVVGWLSRRAESDAQSAPNHRDAANALDAARRRAVAANALLAVGGALALGGVVWGWTAKRRRARTELGVGPAGVAVRMRF